MAASIYDWSLTPASNGNSDADSTWSEGQAPSTVNNTGRSDRTRVRQLLTDIGGSLPAGGTANGLTVTAASPFTALSDGMIIAFRATASNSGAATLNVNSIGAKAIRKMDATGDVALAANEIRNTGIYVAQYSAALNGAAGAWLLVNPTPANFVTLTGVQVLTNKTLSQPVINTPTLVLAQGANPTPTAEGDTQWDTDDNHFAVGDGVGTRKIGKTPTVQTISTPGAFVYTPTAGARFADFELAGGGGAGGNVDGQAGASGGAGGGGASGFYGRTGPIDITGAATFSGSIGAAGAVSGSTFGDGGNGGNTTITVGATTYTAGGGTGGGGMTAGLGYGSQDGGAPGVGTNLVGFSQPGEMGVWSGTDTNATGGNGGSSPFGSGGKGQHRIAAGGAGGLPSAGFGAGGAGACVTNTTANNVGSAGTAGYIRVWEYY